MSYQLDDPRMAEPVGFEPTISDVTGQRIGPAMLRLRVILLTHFSV